MTARPPAGEERSRRADAFLAHLDDARHHAARSTTRPTSTRWRRRSRWPGARCANRFAILPMEGWDGTDDGRPTDLVRRRWQRFGTSGAGLVWGGEAFAVRPDGRANPHQLCLGPIVGRRPGRAPRPPRPGAGHRPPAHPQRALVGRAAARPARDPLLDARRAGAVLTAERARRPRRRLRHRRPPRAGRRLRLRRRQGVPRLPPPRAAVRTPASWPSAHGHDAHDHRARPRRGHPGRRAAVDRSTCRPTSAGPDGVGEPEAAEPWGFNDPLALIDLLGIDLLCITAGSPYYCPHAQRPAWTPAQRRLRAARGPPRRRGPAARRRRRHRGRPARTSRSSPPASPTSRSGCPTSPPRCVRDGGAALVGIGRMALSYPDLPADVLAGRRARPASACAAPSATAPRRRATASSPAAIPWTRCTRSTPTDRCSSRPRSAPVPEPTRGRGRRARHRADARVVVAPHEGPLRVVAVADPDEARADDAAERTGAAIVTFEEAIERDDVDIVDLCTPPSLHLEQITAALAAGKHVVCEKPLVASLRDCDTLAEAEAASAGPAHADLPVPVRQRPPEGEGPRRPRASPARPTRRRSRSPGGGGPTTTRCPGAGGGRPSSAACSSARRSTPSTCSPTSPAPPAKVFARVTTRVNDIEVEDCAAISLELADGSLATITATLGSEQEITRHRFHFANLSAESGTSAYESIGRPVGHPARRRRRRPPPSPRSSTAGSRAPRAGGASSSASATGSTAARPTSRSPWPTPARRSSSSPPCTTRLAAGSTSRSPLRPTTRLTEAGCR